MESLDDLKKKAGKAIGVTVGASLLMAGAASAAQAERYTTESLKNDKEVRDVLKKISESSRVQNPHEELMQKINEAKINKDSFYGQTYGEHEDSASVKFNVGKDGGGVTFSGGNLEEMADFPKALKESLTEIADNPVRFLGTQIINSLTSEGSEKYSNNDDMDRHMNDFSEF